MPTVPRPAARAPGHRLGFGFGWRLEGRSAGRSELRLEGPGTQGSRSEAASGATERRIGLTLDARW